MDPLLSSGKAAVFKRGYHDHACRRGQPTEVVTAPPDCHGKPRKRAGERECKAVPVGPELSEGLGVAGLSAGEPLGMLIALTAKVSHALAPEKGKVALNPCGCSTPAEFPELLTMLLAVGNGLSQRQTIKVLSDGWQIFEG